jgi:hypothetical protein
MSLVTLRVRASIAVLLATVAVAAQAAEIRSPDGQTVVTVDVDKTGAPRYTVARNGKVVMPAGFLPVAAGFRRRVSRRGHRDVGAR